MAKLSLVGGFVVQVDAVLTGRSALRLRLDHLGKSLRTSHTIPKVFLEPCDIRKLWNFLFGEFCAIFRFELELRHVRSRGSIVTGSL